MKRLVDVDQLVSNICSSKCGHGRGDCWNVSCSTVDIIESMPIISGNRAEDVHDNDLIRRVDAFKAASEATSSFYGTNPKMDAYLHFAMNQIPSMNQVPSVVCDECDDCRIESTGTFRYGDEVDT